MAESLIFRKGLQAKLANLPIKPGAISITVDEPGMYIDLPANAAYGHATDYRVRIGDVITVKTIRELADLKNITPGDLSDDNGATSLEGRISVYSASALYYVSDKNMLLKYDSSTEKFVWINDTSNLQQSIADLTTNLTTNYYSKSDIDAKKFATETFATNAANGAEANAKAHANNLDTQVRAAFAAADEALGESITEISTNLTNNYYTSKQIDDKQFATETFATNAATGAETRAKSHANSLDAQVRADFATADEALGTRITGVANDLRTNYYTSKQIDDKQFATETFATNAANTAETNAKSHANNLDTQVRADFAAADEGLGQRITGVANDLDKNYYTKEEIDGFGLADGESIAKDIADAEARAKAYTEAQDTIVRGEFAAADLLLDEKISGVSTNLTKNYYTSAQIDAKKFATETFATNAANTAESNAKGHADGLDAQVRIDFAAADKALSERITGLTQSLNGYVTTETLTETVETINQAIADAAEGAVEDATSAANGYTDDKFTAFNTEYATYKEGVAQQIAGLNDSKANVADVYDKDAIDNLEEALKKYADDAVSESAGTINEAIAKETEDREKAISELDEKITQHADAAAKTYATTTQLSNEIAGAKGHAETKAAAAETNAKAYADGLDAAVREAFAKADAALSEDITELSTNLTNNYYTSKQIDAKNFATESYADQAAADAVANVLRAAEAMRYMGTLTSGNPIDEVTKKTGVEAGDVWVVATISDDGVYHPGDMLIATVDGADVSSEWTHVKTGYDASLEQQFNITEHADVTLDADGQTVTTANGIKVELDSIGSSNTDTLVIRADMNSAIRVTSSGEDNRNGVATIGMVWEDF